MDREGRALAWFTFDSDSSVVRTDRFLDNGKTKTGAAPCLFRCEKWLEDLCHMIRLNTVTCIDDFDGHSTGLMRCFSERDGIDR